MIDAVRARNGKTYRLSKLIGRGGEASVYRVAGEPELLAKIYTRPSADREDKLLWMIGNPPADPAAKLNHTSIAWPREAVYHEGHFAGYLMPHIRDSVQVLNVFHPRLRQQTFHRFTRIHLHNTAFNIAAALGAIHARAYVVGDLNESNVLVARSTLVTLIDTDSFQVRVPGRFGAVRTHFCEVGKPEYLPPELQGADLKTTVREPEHDRFALAVLVFQLLTDGNHPFRARWVGSGEKPSFQERIRRGWFPYREGVGRYVEPAVPLETMHPLLVDLFKRCFILGHDSPAARPKPAEWENALGEAARSFVSCPNGHYRSPHLDRCPECEAGPRPTNRPVRMAAEPPAPPAAVSPSIPIAAVPPAAAPQAAAGPAQSTAAFRIGLPFAIRGPSIPWPQIGSRIAGWRRRFERWIRSGPAQNFVLQPAFWALIGFAAGGLASLQIAARTVGQAAGLVGGLTIGAFAGDVVERKVGWEIFLGGLGAVTGLMTWYLVGTNGGLTGWIVSAAAGGVAGSLLGRYGRMARLTLLWAAAGALGGWLAGGALAGPVSPEWLSGALSAGISALVTGMAYALWKKYGP